MAAAAAARGNDDDGDDETENDDDDTNENEEDRGGIHGRGSSSAAADAAIAASREDEDAPSPHCSEDLISRRRRNMLLHSHNKTTTKQQSPFIPEEEEDDDDDHHDEPNSVAVPQTSNAQRDDDDDDDAVELLQQIFPHETADTLRQLHSHRCVAVSRTNSNSNSNSSASNNNNNINTNNNSPVDTTTIHTSALSISADANSPPLLQQQHFHSWPEPHHHHCLELPCTTSSPANSTESSMPDVASSSNTTTTNKSTAAAVRSRSVCSSSSNGAAAAVVVVLPKTTLPPNFLRLPPDVAVRRAVPTPPDQNRRHGTATNQTSPTTTPTINNNGTLEQETFWNDGTTTTNTSTNKVRTHTNGESHFTHATSSSTITTTTPSSSWRYEFVSELTQQAVAQHERRYPTTSSAAMGPIWNPASDGCYDQNVNNNNNSKNAMDDDDKNDGSYYYYYYVSKVVTRNPVTGGLGMTLIANQQNNLVCVHSLVGLDEHHEEWTFSDDKQQQDHFFPSRNDYGGPALSAGVQCGDVLIGIDGIAFVESISATDEGSLVRHAVARCRSGPDPVVLHLLRRQHVDGSKSATTRTVTTSPKCVSVHSNNLAMTPSLLDTSDLVSEDSSYSWVSSAAPMGDLSSSFHSDLSDSQMTPVFSNSQKISIHPFVHLLARANLLQSHDEKWTASHSLRALDARNRQWEDIAAFVVPSTDSIVPLAGVRKALSVRIVNAFEDGDDTAFTVWVYDAELGKEWYAPLRHHRDFDDLRSATLPLCPSSIKQIPFPHYTKRSALNLFLSPVQSESDGPAESKCRQLEIFLRFLCAMIYKEELHPYMAEIAIHVQSFLGCDEKTLGVPAAVPRMVGVDHDAPMSPCSFSSFASAHDEDDEVQQQNEARQKLKRYLQRYTFRLFLLDSMSRTVDAFVDAVRRKGPRWQDIEALESKGHDVLKVRAMEDLHQVQVFMDRVQDMIIDGCIDDFEVIGDRMEYEPIHSLIHNSKGGAGFWDTLVREAVREQVEIEIYVPLRSVVSRWLVNGWRHEDMEVHFRMKELSRRSQDFFRIAKGDGCYDWSSVSQILYEGVGQSTLPCLKLRAVVDAAREVFRIFSHEQQKSNRYGKTTNVQMLGADDFLPIFIYCVVQAEIERPCALCVLLRTLCDRLNRIGEIGYYLLSFEAAIKHCEEVDLSDNHEEMPSFLSIPLDDD